MATHSSVLAWRSLSTVETGGLQSIQFQSDTAEVTTHTHTHTHTHRHGCVGCVYLGTAQRPHGLQPSRLLHPWDLPGKSTGVGCHCLLHINPAAAAAAAKLLQSCPTLCDPIDGSPPG